MKIGSPVASCVALQAKSLIQCTGNTHRGQQVVLGTKAANYSKISRKDTISSSKPYDPTALCHQYHHLPAQSSDIRCNCREANFQIRKYKSENKTNENCQ